MRGAHTQGFPPLFPHSPSLGNLEGDYDDKEVGRGAGSEADDGKRLDTSLRTKIAALEAELADAARRAEDHELSTRSAQE